jgi:hypothetical protein
LSLNYECFLIFESLVRDESKVGIYLKYVSGILPVEVDYIFILVSYVSSINNKKHHIIQTGKYFVNADGKPTGWGPVNFITHEKLFKEQDEYFPDGKLRFVTKIVLSYKSDSSNLMKSSIILKNAYENMNHSDVKFRASDNELIPAHKNILSASSDVFKAMFSHDGTTENETGIIESSDMNSEILKEMVRFIYCEAFFQKLESAKEQEIELYNAAEKYHLESLKKICLNSIYRRLDVINVLDFVEFAELFNLGELFSCCILIIFA